MKIKARTTSNYIWLILLFLMCAPLALAQSTSGGSYTIPQSVIAGGGGTSSSGSSQVDGTVGQSVTGTSSGGTFTLSSGFWTGDAALTTSTLSVTDVAGTYGGTVSVTATLTANGSNLSGQLISFTLNGTTLSTATTDTNGVATLNNVSLSGINAGTYPGAVTAQFAGDTTFTASTGTGQLTVQKATPLLQVAGGTFTYDGQPHPATATVTGINNEALSPLTVLYNGSSTVPLNVGTYAITASFAGNQNYNSVTNDQQSIVIGKAEQMITFAALANKTFGDPDFAISATVSSDLSVSFAATGQCTVSGNTVHLTGAGSCTITASQAGDGNYNSAQDVDQSFTINTPPNMTITDASQAEPSSGSTNATFTVALSAPSLQTITVNFTTADNTAKDGVGEPEQDYTPTSGTLTFTPGQTLQTISVPVLPDADNAEGNETFFVNLTGSTNSNITDTQATGTITTTALPAGQVLISEVRTSGPDPDGGGPLSGSDNDFVEIYNNSDTPLTVPAGGYGLFKMGATCADTPVLIGTIPAGTIPARGHYLFVGTGYSLANYGGANAATGNQTLSSNIEPDSNVALFSTANLAALSSANRLDAVGFVGNTSNNCDLLREGTGLPATTGSAAQYSFARTQNSTGTADSNNNAADFILVATDPSSLVGATAVLGAPGPENLSSPIRNAVIGTGIVNTSEPAFGTNNNNYNRDLSPVTNGASGTMSFRRTLTNPAGAAANITRIRIRIREITTLNSPGYVLGGTQTDLRALTSSSVAVTFTGGGAGTANGIALEEPPTQSLGGGLNSSWSVTLPGPGLAPGATTAINITVGVQQPGTFRFAVIIEALP